MYIHINRIQFSLKVLNEIQDWMRIFRNLIEIYIYIESPRLIECLWEGQVHINLCIIKTNLINIVTHSWTCLVCACLSPFVSFSISQLIISNWSLADRACEHSQKKKNVDYSIQYIEFISVLLYSHEQTEYDNDLFFFSRYI
jgi:hypothetical protein